MQCDEAGDVLDVVEGEPLSLPIEQDGTLEMVRVLVSYAVAKVAEERNRKTVDRLGLQAALQDANRRCVDLAREIAALHKAVSGHRDATTILEAAEIYFANDFDPFEYHRSITEVPELS